jgi:hypothetical protein
MERTRKKEKKGKERKGKEMRVSEDLSYGPIVVFY